MRGAALLILLSTTALAGTRSARRAVEAAQEAVSDSDADCSRKLSRKLAALEDERPSPRQVRAVIDFAADECPRKLAAKVRRALQPLTGEDEDDEDDDDERPSRRDARPRRRDCGTGEDPGCGSDPAPMDAVAFRGLLDALRSNGNEYTRLDVLRNTLGHQRLTAAQLGPILDSFQNEFLKLDAAKAAVPRLVNPQHAFGHASRFRNTFIAADFTKLLSTR
ncbi:MAG: hypothetical protein DI536_02030 [Archangium gephyra]|uniref:DUF4476 domain-containing protein n=1 Tax=Archangium gephyra TaxID=48 RepID=A0A2W5TZM1_9BACT|nr:MAG: hypothetical protein DI536_02030 [Archangium gephyra]